MDCKITTFPYTCTNMGHPMCVWEIYIYGSEHTHIFQTPVFFYFYNLQRQMNQLAKLQLFKLSRHGDTALDI